MEKEGEEPKEKIDYATIVFLQVNRINKATSRQAFISGVNRLISLCRPFADEQFNKEVHEIVSTEPYDMEFEEDAYDKAIEAFNSCLDLMNRIGLIVKRAKVEKF
jgi:hypothetical protein